MPASPAERIESELVVSFQKVGLCFVLERRVKQWARRSSGEPASNWSLGGDTRRLGGEPRFHDRRNPSLETPTGSTIADDGSRLSDTRSSSQSQACLAAVDRQIRPSNYGHERYWQDVSLRAVLELPVRSHMQCICRLMRSAAQQAG
jgi:hypothetical protein